MQFGFTGVIWSCLLLMTFELLSCMGEANAKPEANPIHNSLALEKDTSQLPNPRIVEHPQDKYFSKNNPSTLHCKVDGEPPPSIRWYRDGQPVETTLDNAESNRMLLNNGSQLFFLRVIHTKTNKPDVGVYYCTASNIHGTAVSRNATVKIATLRDDFVQEPVDTGIAVGNSVTLLCRPPRGEPEPTVIWLFNSEPLETNGRVLILKDGDLKFDSVLKQDAGDYRCQAKNEAGVKTSRPAKLSVYDVPVIDKHPKDVTVGEGQNVEFHCGVTGDPPLSITWKKEGGDLNTNDRVYIDRESGTLRIEDVKAGDEGTYICMAQNGVGSSQAIARLKVEYPPSFLVRPKNQIVARGRTVTLQCVATGSPVPAVYWSIGSPPTLVFPKRESGRLSVAEDGTFRIENVLSSDEGEYTCVAYSSKGESKASARIIVREHDVRPPPIIKIGPQNQTLPLDSNALLLCQALGEPQPHIRWYRDGHPLSMNDARYTLLNSGTLQISSLMLEDTGMYACKAVSETGETTWEAFLKVEASSNSNPSVLVSKTPDISSFPVPPSKPDVDDVMDTAVHLQWQPNIDHEASPPFGYQVEYFGYGADSGWVVVNALVQSEDYVVFGLHPNTSYIFLVRARNSHGVGGPSEVSDIFRTLEPIGGRQFSKAGFNISEIENRLKNVVIELEEAKVINSSAIRLKWKIENHQSIVDGYYIRYRHVINIQQKRYSQSRVKRVPFGPTFYIITGLGSYEWYEICIIATSGTKQTRCSGFMTVVTGESVPSGVPLDIVVQRESDSRIVVRWSPPEFHEQNGKIIAYQIKCLSEDGMHNCSRSTNGSVNSVIIDNLLSGVNYHIQVAAQTKYGLGDWSQALVASSEQSDLLQKSWFIGTLIGAAGGTLWIALCIFTIILCRKRRNRKKLKEQWFSTGATGPEQKQGERNGNALRNVYGFKDASSRSATVNKEEGLPPELAMLLQGKKEEEGPEEDIYTTARDPPELRTFNQKSSPVTPYATTTLLQAQAKERAMAQAQNKQGSDNSFRPINQGYTPHSSGSNDSNTDRSNTDENGFLIKQNMKPNRGYMFQTQTVNLNDVLPPPPDHLPNEEYSRSENQPQYSELQDGCRPGFISRGHQMVPHCMSHVPSMSGYPPSDCTKCQSQKYLDGQPYSTKQGGSLRNPSLRQNFKHNPQRTLVCPHHSASPRGTPVMLHGYSQPWDCAPRGMYEFARLPGTEYDYSQPQEGEFIHYSQPPGGVPREIQLANRSTPSDHSHNSISSSRSGDSDKGRLPYLQVYRIVPPSDADYRVLGDKGHLSCSDHGEERRTPLYCGGDQCMDRACQSSLPSLASEGSNLPSLYTNRGERNSRVGRNQQDSPVSEDPDYAAESDLEPFPQLDYHERDKHKRRRAQRSSSPGYSTDSNYGSIDGYKSYPRARQKKRPHDKAANLPSYSKPNFPSSPLASAPPSSFTTSARKVAPPGDNISNNQDNIPRTTSPRAGGIFQFGDIPVV
ncbi:hypothetical protein CHS0354_016993 [Potamilus streckersoni]|uniref:Uncharacterized protein n=1 Tax=Potamilus streckersoni TaxID=2493646 RepID=A0AAE0S8E9_9BIVA|nr:hypothetical protein CHS0354_016993 [Potamilus streckersoni]